jgi:ProP effector
MALRATKFSLPAFKEKTPVRLPLTEALMADHAGASLPRRPETKRQPAGKEKPPKNAANIATNAMQKTLAKRFPNCFKKFNEPKQPLMINVHLAVFAAAPNLSRRYIRAAIRGYVGYTNYLSAMVEGAVRIDLDGNAAGVVTAADAQSAQERLAKRARLAVPS